MRKTLLLILTPITAACICFSCAPQAASSTTNKTVSANITAAPATTSTTKKVPTTPTPAPAAPANLPVIKSFAATPSIVKEGGLSSLAWEVTNAVSVSISPTVGQVGPWASLDVSPETSTIYTLAATNPQGTATATATVMVEKPYSTLLPVVLDFSVDPRTISENDSCDISWNIYGADAVQISVGSGKTSTIVSQRLTPTGKMTALPTFTALATKGAATTTIPTSTTTYVLTAKNVTGTTTAAVDVTLLTTAILPKPGIPMAQDNVTVMAATVLPMIRWFSAEPATIVQGNAATVTWEVNQATKILLNGVAVPAIGSRVISPAAPVTYTLTASNEYWTISKALTVGVLSYKPEWFKPVVR